jgi:o-succinylbenzoate---CoA ligase
MVEPGQDRASSRLVALQGLDGPELVAAIERCWATGDAVLPLPAGLPVEGRERTLEALDAGGPVPEGTAAVLLTSGSTGTPKGVTLSHAALEASARASLDRLGAGPDDRWLCCLPLHHVAGIAVLVRSRLLAVPAVVHGGFDVEAVAGADVTMVALVPTMLHRLLDAGADVARFRVILLGGAALPDGLLDRARAAGARVVCSYGMTETCGGCVYDGVPLDGVTVRLADAGRVEISGAVLMDGYRDDPARTAAVLRDGWLRTADVGVWSDGRLRVLGRADDVIVTGGEKVAAGEVAALLETHPRVAAAAVYGRADPEWGQRVVARIVAHGPAPTLDELRAFVKERAEPASAPTELEVL